MVLFDIFKETPESGVERYVTHFSDTSMYNTKIVVSFDSNNNEYFYSIGGIDISSNNKYDTINIFNKVKETYEEKNRKKINIAIQKSKRLLARLGI